MHGIPRSSGGTTPRVALRAARLRRAAAMASRAWRGDGDGDGDGDARPHACSSAAPEALGRGGLRRRATRLEARDARAPDGDILVVEDERIVALDVREQLARLGYASRTASDAAEALALVRARAPRLVLMDVRLGHGGPDGIDAARAVCALADVPVVYVTAYADETTLARARATEAYGYVLKPFSEGALRVAIEMALARHATARALREREAWLAATLRSVPDGVLAVDAAGAVRFANAPAARLVGRAHGAVVGQPADELLRFAPPPVEPAAELPHRVLLATDGAARPVDVRHTPIDAADDEGAGGEVWVLRDVAAQLAALERRRVLDAAGAALEAARDSDVALERLARLLAATLCDECRIALVGEDDGVLRVAALARGDAPGAPAAAPPRGAPSPGALRVAHRGLTERRAGPAAAAWDDTLDADDARTATEATTTSSVLCVPLRARGHALGALELLRGARRAAFDDADEALLEEIARRAALALDNLRLYEQARRAVRARDEVLAAVSHELRNALSVVNLNAEQCARAVPAEETGPALPAAQVGPHLRRLATIQRAVRQMDRLIRDLLDAAALDAGRLALAFTRCPLADIVREAAEQLGPLAAKQRVALETGPVPPDLVVACDRERIHQVLANLIGNAVKFTPPGGTITLRVEPTARGEVRVAVTDTGRGIAPEHLPHVFDRFWTAPAAHHRGTGLGLSIARRLVEAHGGEIHAESTPGVGSTFAFTLPRT